MQYPSRLCLLAKVLSENDAERARQLSFPDYQLYSSQLWRRETLTTLSGNGKRKSTYRLEVEIMSFVPCETRALLSLTNH